MSQNKFTTLKDVQQAAQKTVVQAQEIQAKQRGMFEELLAEVEQINPQLGGFDEMAVLLSLPDDQFSMISPIFLAELEKSFNNIDDKLFLAQAMNAAGTKVEDVQEAYTKIIESIDEQFSEILSAPKRDFLKKMFSMVSNSIADVQGATKRIVQIPIELTSENAKIPTYANLGDAAVDLYCPEDVTIGPGETKIIPVEIKTALPLGYAFLIHPRSGLSAKTKLRVANSIGLIDSQYKGIIGVILENIEPPIKNITYDYDEKNRPVLISIEHGKSYTLNRGDRFAQMRLVEVPTASFLKVETVDGIGEDRGGGFGSSGM